MAVIRRGTIPNNFVSTMKLDQGSTPNEASEKIVLTFDYANVKFCDIVRNVARTATGVSTIYTTPTDQDFYLSSVSVQLIADATNDSTSGFVRATIGGASRFFLITKFATTATQSAMQWNLPVPIKIDRGTNITVEYTSTAGAMNVNGTIVGFTIEG